MNMANVSIPSKISVEVDISQAALHETLKTPYGDVGRFSKKLGHSTLSKAKQKVPVRTGALKNSLRMEQGIPGFPNGVEIIADIRYALPVHQGVRPRTIRPKPPKRFLRFPDKFGVIVYAREVHQGPRAPKPFLWDALRETIEEMK